MAMPSKGASGFPTSPIDALTAGMQQRLDRLPARLSHQRVFLSTYQRTTQAIGDAVRTAPFEDPEWVQRWDVAFANLYLGALDAELAGGELVPGPWRLAFTASPDLPPLRHVLLCINAHINYDLPRALLTVISDDDFSDRVLIERYRRDSELIDTVLASQVEAAGDELTATPDANMFERLLMPLNRLSAKRFLHEARQKVWHNTLVLHQSRVAGPAEYAVRLDELEVVSAAKVSDLLLPGQVMLRLAISGFGVSLAPHDRGTQ
jgi:hypothetical protein